MGTLFAANTSNGTLEVFSLASGIPVFQTRVPVGLEPVAVAVRSNTELWEANLLSEGVSVISLVGTPHVTATAAFITTAHRGQQRTDPSTANVPGAGDPRLPAAGVPRSDVWEFRHPTNSHDGRNAFQIVSFFTDTPRALAVSPDGNTVYGAGFNTGNQTTTINQGRVCTGWLPNTPCTLPDGSTNPGWNPGPSTDSVGEPAPEMP
jgi:DNA-binding beta-propeller fold protein YncE